MIILHKDGPSVEGRRVCEPERRGQYSNNRSGASVETARKAGDRRQKIKRFFRLTRPYEVRGSRASHARIALALRAF